MAHRTIDPAAATAAVLKWNEAHPIGTPVLYYPVLKEDGSVPNDFPPVETITRSQAWIMPGQIAVVAVADKRGAVGLRNVKVRKL